MTHIITLSSAPTSAMQSQSPPPPHPLLAAPPKSLPTQPHIFVCCNPNPQKQKGKKKT